MNIAGWLLFIVILGIDLAIYAMISMQMDGTWDKIHEDTDRIHEDTYDK